MKMNIQALKIDIIHWLTEIEDEGVLEKIQEIREGAELGSLSASQKEELNIRIQKFKNEVMEFKSWEQVRNNIKERYKSEI